jgi:hypothetical protein
MLGPSLKAAQLVSAVLIIAALGVIIKKRLWVSSG